MSAEVEKWNLLSKEDKKIYANLMIEINEEFLKGAEPVLEQLDQLPQLKEKYLSVYTQVSERKERIQYYKQQLELLEKIMNRPMVYLAGPITGLNYEGCTDWRQKAIDYFNEQNIAGLSPMRAKEYLKKHKTIQDSYENGVQAVLSGQRGIFARDRFDCFRADLVIVNMLGAKRVSIGTVMEIAWANSQNIPIVLIMEKGDPQTDTYNIHEHSMLREACPFRVSTLEEGLDLTRIILLPSNKA